MISKKHYFKKNYYNQDFIFNTLWIRKIINILTKHTLVHKIETKFYKTFSQLKLIMRLPAIFLIYNTLRNQKLLFKILRVKIAGRIYQLPTNFNAFNRYAVALRWLLKNISNKGISMFSERISKILFNESFIKNNITDKVRHEIYETITSYRGYLHFRWRN